MRPARYKGLEHGYLQAAANRVRFLTRASTRYRGNMNVSVTYSLGEIRARDISESTVVVIDCFRASTSIVSALAAGANAVYPFSGVGQARKEAAARGNVILAGERGGARIPGFALGNSPGEFTAEAVGGRDVVMTTTNGTQILTASSSAADVFVAGFVNASVTARAVLAIGSDVVLAAAGTEGHFSVEDGLCAGLLTALVAAEGRIVPDDAAIFARAAYEGAKPNVAAAARAGRGARNVKALGLEKDLDVCLAIDSMPIIAKVALGPLRVVRP